MSSSNTQNRFQSTARNVADTSKEFVEDHAIPATTAAFALGFGVGIALAFAFSDRRQHHEAGVANRLGRQVLDAMSCMMPDAISNLRK